MIRDVDWLLTSKESNYTTVIDPPLICPKNTVY